MTPQDFIAKWALAPGNERQTAQAHFLDLCDLLGEPKPGPGDPDYTFEKGVHTSGSGRGFADVWRRGCFAMEYKRRGGDLAGAFVQLQRYALALDNPPLLVVCDIDTIVIRTAWTNTVSETHTLPLRDLADPRRLRLLKWMLSEPERLRPQRTRQALTEEVAAKFAELADRLRRRGHDPLAVAHFINRLVFCLFADHAGLLPAGVLAKMLTQSGRNPTTFERFARELFAALSKQDGFVGFDRVPWFNGGLFDDDAALPLEASDVALLQAVRSQDWTDIDVSIFGTLFERGLDPRNTTPIGAHYTDRDKIMLIIEPVITRPLRAEWEAAKARIAQADRRDREGIYHAFLDRLAAFRVLDPACGSGNFLYLAVQALQDIEHLAVIEAGALGFGSELLARARRVGPEAVLGIEINPFAAELARVSVWIGHIQWARRNGVAWPTDPVLRTLDTIECRDAVLALDGTAAAWPTVDVIVGNPPFLGDKVMRSRLGDAATGALRAAYAGRVPGGADLVCFWVEAARAAVAGGRAARAGLVTTNSIRGGSNRQVLDRVAADCVLFDAWSDEPWTVDGVAVRVSIVCFGRDGGVERRLDGEPVARISADLSARATDLTAAVRLAENLGVCFQGTIKVGPFDVDGATARAWLAEPANANGRPNADVVKPWRNALHVLRRMDDAWIIDFGATMGEREAQFYAGPFGHVARHVKPMRDDVNRSNHRRLWWLHGEARPGMRVALGPLQRYIVTPRVAKHRVFVWFERQIVPDTRLVVIARHDDVTFGILHSRFHESWSLRLASWHGVGNDPTYNNHSCFETFPFPLDLTPNRSASAYETDPRAQDIAEAARALDAARDAWLNPGELCERVADILPHLPARIVPRDAAAAVKLNKRTLTKLYNTRGTPEGAWLDALHADLDAAVARAYGWSEDIAEEDALAALLALNAARTPAPAARAGHAGVARGGTLRVATPHPGPLPQGERGK